MTDQISNTIKNEFKNNSPPKTNILKVIFYLDKLLIIKTIKCGSVIYFDQVFYSFAKNK
jgi:hypothetical protein